MASPIIIDTDTFDSSGKGDDSKSILRQPTLGHSLGQGLVEYSILGALIIAVAIPVVGQIAENLGSEVTDENRIITNQGLVSSKMPSSDGMPVDTVNTTNTGEGGEDNDCPNPDPLWGCF